MEWRLREGGIHRTQGGEGCWEDRSALIAKAIRCSAFCKSQPKGGEQYG